MTNQLRWRRGDVVLVRAGGHEPSSSLQETPVVVIQGELGNEYGPNLIVAPVSKSVPTVHYPIHYFIKAGSPVALMAGLDCDSIVKAETIVTLPRSAVIRRIGTLPPDATAEIDACLKLTLGLGP